MPVPTVEAPKTVVLKGDLGQGHREYAAGGAITPGHLINLANTGKVVVHASAAGECPPMFAKEDALQGKTIADAYASDDRVFCHQAVSGDEIYAWLEDNHNISIGALLESAGDGTLQALTGDHAIAQALEAVDTTGAPTAAARIRVKVM